MGAALVPIITSLGEGGAAVAEGGALMGTSGAATEVAGAGGGGFNNVSRVASFGQGQGDGKKTPEGAPKKGHEDLNNWFPGAGSH